MWTLRNLNVFTTPFPVIHDQLLGLADIEGEVVVLATHSWQHTALATHSQFSDLLPVGCLISIGDQAYHVVSSANLMMELEMCVATQSWINMEYRRGLSTHPCGTPVLRVSVAEVL
jgi:hypothetical protein